MISAGKTVQYKSDMGNNSWGSLTKKLIVYYEARDTAVNIWGLSGFSVEILEDRACDKIQGDRNKIHIVQKLFKYYN